MVGSTGNVGQGREQNWPRVSVEVKGIGTTTSLGTISLTRRQVFAALNSTANRFLIGHAAQTLVESAISCYIRDQYGIIEYTIKRKDIEVQAFAFWSFNVCLSWNEQVFMC